MTPFRFYYAFDLVPAYWTELEKHIHSGKVVVLDSVKEEINKGDDDLAKWIRDIDGLTVIPKVTAQTVSCYQEVIQYVARYFGVKTIDVFDMMRRLDITIT